MEENYYVMDIRVLASIWGEAYAEIFLKWSLPSLLSNGNSGRIIDAGHNLKFCLFGDSSILEVLRSHNLVNSSGGIDFQFYDISETLFDGKPIDFNLANYDTLSYTHELQSRCFMCGMEQSTEDKLAFIFWAADFILSDGGLAWAVQQVDGGQKAVYCDFIEISQQAITVELNTQFKNLGDGPSGRQLADIALRHPHQDTLDHFCDNGSISAYPPFLFWRSEDDSFVHTGIFPHPLVVCFDGSTTRFESSIDYEFAQRVVGDGPYIKAIDSDDLLLCAVGGESAMRQFERNTLTPEWLAKFLILEANISHFELAQKIGIVHSSDIEPSSEIKRSQITQFFQAVREQLILIGNKSDLGDLKTLMAVKSFFGPCALYASPQRQIINQRLLDR